MQRLFVYGSLQPGGDNEHILAGLEGNWRSGSVRGRLVAEGWGAELGFPGIVLDKEAEWVRGQVFSSDELEAEWSFLDDFEGSDYKRVTTTVRVEGGDEVSASVYVLRHS